MATQLKAGVYKSSKGNTIVIAEDGRNLWALYNNNQFGKREKWPLNCKTYEDFVRSQKLVRENDWNGVFF
jgi:hypothetical protein